MGNNKINEDFSNFFVKEAEYICTFEEKMCRFFILLGNFY